MKNLYKRKWKEDAVSPVIATILMVAITVVLAAVLYLLVSGLIGGGGTIEPNINLTTGSPTGTAAEWKIDVGGASSGEGLANYDVAVTKNVSIAIAAASLDGLGSSCSGTPGVAFQDATGDSQLNAGDWFILCGTDDSSDYQINIFWKNTGNKVSGNTGRINQ